MSCKEITGAFSVCLWIFSKKKKKRRKVLNSLYAAHFTQTHWWFHSHLNWHVFTSHQAFLNTQNDNDSCNIVHNTALYQLCREKKLLLCFTEINKRVNNDRSFIFANTRESRTAEGRTFASKVILSRVIG